MFKTRLLAGVLLVFMLLTAQVGMAAAAPLSQDATITISGIVTEIGEPEADENGVTTVLVTLLLEDQTTQTVRISDVLAAGLEIGQQVSLQVDPNDVIPDEEPVEEDVHPIAWLLAEFFFPDDPEMASVIDGYHEEDGFGFGVIAQALWMSQSLTEGEDASAAGLILEAKRSGDYSEFSEWFDGPVPTNWGQFKKELRENKDKHNLGVIVSGQADDGSEDALNAQDHGNGKNKKPKKDKNPHKP
jgi:hypothetical protein